jgi:Uma2 family endonuclease
MTAGRVLRWGKSSSDTKNRMQTETATKKLFTVDEYYRMSEAGILKRDQRTELINGEIIEMSSMNALHAAGVGRAGDFLGPLFRGKAHVRVQLPIRLDQFNEPQPDISIVKPRADFYKAGHPQPADVLLILEISHTTLPYDRDVKLPVYAACHITEVWIEDLAKEFLLVFRQPSKGHYRTRLTLTRNDSLALLAFPEIEFSVAELLG